VVWSSYLVRPQSGEKRLPIKAADNQWGTVINGIGDGQTTLKLGDLTPSVNDALAEDETRPWDRAIVTCWDDVPMYAGLIMRHRWVEKTGTLLLKHRELREIASRRHPFMVPTFNKAGTLVISGKSKRGILRRLIEIAYISEPGDNWHFPVALGPDEAGAEPDFVKPNEKITNIEQMFSEVQDMDGGPDWYLRPAWDGNGRLYWQSEIGAPKLSAGMAEYHAFAATSPVTELAQDTDGTGQASGVFGVGEGSGQDMIVGRAGPLVGYPQIPDMDVRRSYKGVESEDVANSLALGDLKSIRNPTRQLSFKLHASELSRVKLGSTVRLHLDGSKFLSGVRDTYVIGISSDGTDHVTVEVQ